MYWISFGRWSSAAGRRFIMERIYVKGHWTPFVRVRKRKITAQEELIALLKIARRG